MKGQANLSRNSFRISFSFSSRFSAGSKSQPPPGHASAPAQILQFHKRPQHSQHSVCYDWVTR